jgi:aconitate hydratase
MGILPLEFAPGTDRTSLGLTGEEIFEIAGLPERIVPRSRVTVKTANATTGASTSFEAIVRIDTPDEAEYYRHGGILQYVLRQLRAAA